MACRLSMSLLLLLPALLPACAQRAVLLPWKGAGLACLRGMVSACSLQPTCMQAKHSIRKHHLESGQCVAGTC
jgi:hypothetical protein